VSHDGRATWVPPTRETACSTPERPANEFAGYQAHQVRLRGLPSHPPWSSALVVEGWGAHIGGLGASVAAVSTARRRWSPAGGFANAHLTVESTGRSMRTHKAERLFPTNLTYTLSRHSTERLASRAPLFL